MARNIKYIIIAAIVLVLLFGGALITFYTDWLWFDNLGFGAVFSKVIWTKITLFAVSALLFFGIVYSNLVIAQRIAPPATRRYSQLEDDIRDRLGALARRGAGLLALLAAIVLALITGLQTSLEWNRWLLYKYATPFKLADPIFRTDIGFYVFKLPFLDYVVGWLFYTFIVAFIASAAIHYIYGGIDFLANSPRFAPKVKSHLAILLSLLFFIKALDYRLAMYHLVQSTVQTTGTSFYGAGYTDINARLPALWILLFAAVIAGLVVLFTMKKRGVTFAAGAVIGLIGLSMVVGVLYPAAVNSVVVAPNALGRQRPYIQHAINFTRTAFNLTDATVETQKFDYQPTLTAQQLQNNEAAVQNLRLWDYDPLTRTYQQLQEFQQYYSFGQVDIDRYIVDGDYRQVMLSARELPGPPQNAQTWINQRLRYTHGYGYAMSPVNEATTEGLPNFFAKDIPVKTTGGLKLTTPQIYFGEQTSNYVLVDTRQNEFDYPGPNGDVETTYKADSGPAIGSFGRKLAFALRFADTYILLSKDLKPSSRILFRRNISDRSEALFPFLKFDSDPYLVTVDGKLFWFHDAYTTTSEYPYSEPTADGNTNYIRNSVKIVTDAYTGSVTAYVSDPSDPIIQTYQKIFPGTFTPISKMPDTFRAHIRYPEDMFSIQTQVYSKYHMTRPDTFYGGNDLWRIPALGSNGTDQQSDSMEPYYIITRLPNSTEEEFLLIAPFVRAQKENMVAWIAAKCDPKEYGKLILYTFPGGDLVFGPRQIMSRADQDTTISEQFSLWNRTGSSVIRGNLLAIPIENSILYAEPIYLQSERTQLPEYKRVIMALGDKISMQSTISRALSEVTGVQSVPAGAETPPSRPRPGTPQPAPAVQDGPGAEVQSLIRQAKQQNDAAEKALRDGNWAEYGKQQDELKKTLNELQTKIGR